MNLVLFQWIACSGLAVVLVWEARRLRRHQQTWASWLVHSIVWLSALVAIAHPDITQRLAALLGITRGADVVFYSFVLVFTFAAFQLASRQARLQRQINALASQIALVGARRGGGGSEIARPR